MRVWARRTLSAPGTASRSSMTTWVKRTRYGAELKRREASGSAAMYRSSRSWISRRTRQPKACTRMPPGPRRGREVAGR